MDDTRGYVEVQHVSEELHRLFLVDFTGLKEPYRYKHSRLLSDIAHRLENRLSRPRWYLQSGEHTGGTSHHQTWRLTL